MDINAAKNDIDRAHRQAAWDAFNRDTEEINTLPAEGVLPSFVSNYHDAGSRVAIHIKAEKLDGLIEKWSLGIHYHIWNEPASPDADISVIHITDAHAEIAFCELSQFWQEVNLGPGIQISYLSEGVNRSSIYKFVIWGQFTAYGVIDESGHALP